MTTTNIFSITKQNDSLNEEYVYKVGSNGNVPLILLVLLASGAKNAVERYLSIHSDTQTAIELTKQLLKQNPKLEERAKELAEYFDERDAISQERIIKSLKDEIPTFSGFPPPPDDIGAYIKNYPRNTILDFHVYASQLARCLAMITPNYGSGHEGVPQTCSMSYIAFYGREEFVNMNDSANKAFHYVFSEVVRIMKLRKIELNEYDMTLSMESYEALSFREPMYPGF